MGSKKTSEFSVGCLLLGFYLSVGSPNRVNSPRKKIEIRLHRAEQSITGRCFKSAGAA